MSSAARTRWIRLSVRIAISGLMAAEMVIVLVLAVVLAVLLNLAVFTWGDALMNQLLLT